MYRIYSLLIIMLCLFCKLNLSFAAAENNMANCQNLGAKWRQFSNGCADYCAKYETEFSVCTMALTWSCDCGEGKCYDNINNICRVPEQQPEQKSLR